MADERFIAKDHLAPSLAFIRSPLWTDMKRAALQRRPAAADPSQAPHEAAARGFQRDAWENAFNELEKLPFEQPTAMPPDPFERPAVTNTAD